MTAPPSRVAVYPGSFDPITRGHEDLIRRARSFADRVIVAVAVNVAKQPLFTLEERVALIRQVVEEPSVEVRSFDGLLAAFARARIALPGGTDERVRAAAARIEQLRLGSVQLVEGTAPRSPLPEMVRLLRTRHPQRFPNDAAAEAALEHPLTFGAALVGLGSADVMVGGATFPSGDTIRAAVWAVGTAPGITTVSGAFYMVRDDAVLTFTDCAVVPEPTPEQLAESAVAAARDRRPLGGAHAIVAL